MRTIEFRGKSINSDGWCYGKLNEYEDGRVTIIASNDLEVTVDPETIGQYTGCTDYKDHMIFEGDTLEYHILAKRHTGDVVFTNGSFYVKDNADAGCTLLSYILQQSSKIIGTMFDKPDEDEVSNVSNKYLEAEKENRLFILPCPIGQEIYKLTRHCNSHSDCRDDLDCSQCGSWRAEVEPIEFSLRYCRSDGSLDVGCYLTYKEAQYVADAINGGNVK